MWICCYLWLYLPNLLWLRIFFSHTGCLGQTSAPFLPPSGYFAVCFSVHCSWELSLSRDEFKILKSWDQLIVCQYNWIHKGLFICASLISRRRRLNQTVLMNEALLTDNTSTTERNHWYVIWIHIFSFGEFVEQKGFLYGTKLQQTEQCVYVFKKSNMWQVKICAGTCHLQGFFFFITCLPLSQASWNLRPAQNEMVSSVPDKSSEMLFRPDSDFSHTSCDTIFLPLEVSLCKR